MGITGKPKRLILSLGLFDENPNGSFIERHKMGCLRLTLVFIGVTGLFLGTVLLFRGTILDMYENWQR